MKDIEVVYVDCPFCEIDEAPLQANAESGNEEAVCDTCSAVLMVTYSDYGREIDGIDIIEEGSIPEEYRD